MWAARGPPCRYWWYHAGFDAALFHTLIEEEGVQINNVKLVEQRHVLL